MRRREFIAGLGGAAAWPVVARALEARLPTVCEWADMARAGCLIGFGRTAPRCAGAWPLDCPEIFRGAAPGDVAIELPTVFELALNQNCLTSASHWRC